MSDTGEIIKSGAFDKLADIAHKLAGPLAEELGMLMADKVKLYRVKNWVTVVQKTEKILRDASLPPSAVPPRMFLPILEASSIENDETLQDLWAGLLASASEKADSLSPSFVETLKQLTPAEAKGLDNLFAVICLRSGSRLGTPEEMRLMMGNVDQVSFRLITETFERLGLIRRRYDLQPASQNFWWTFPSIQSSFRSATWALGISPKDTHPLPELTYAFEFTDYGIQFMGACKGPKK